MQKLKDFKISPNSCIQKETKPLTGAFGDSAATIAGAGL
jgi:hypothetical protein